MRRVLVLALFLAAMLAGLLFAWLRERAPVLAAAPSPELPATREADPGAVELTYVELAASPHRTELPGATQVYGWLVREDDGRPVDCGLVRLRFHDYSSAPESAAELHAQATAGGRKRASSYRDIRVQDDGGWYSDLPGKCWLASVEFTPAVDAREIENNMVFAEMAESAQLGRLVSGPINSPARSTLIHTAAALEVPLERGAVEITFRASSGIEALGVVCDSQTAEPVPGAHVILRSLRNGQLEGSTDARGAFRMRGIDPQELVPVNGMVKFLVAATGYEHVEREVAWESGQTGLPAFRVVLAPHVR